MLRKAMITSIALATLAVATPASAGGWGGSSSGGWGGSTSGGGCGKKCGGSTSGGSTTSGGTQVPEPGMLGIAGAGLIGLGLIRRRRASKD